MGSDKSSRNKNKRLEEMSSSSLSSSTSDSDSETSSDKRSKRHRRRDDRHKRSIKGSRREKEKIERAKKRAKRKERRDRKENKRKEEKQRLRRNKKAISSSSDDDKSKLPTSLQNPEMLPSVADDLKECIPSNVECSQTTNQADDNQFTESFVKDDSFAPRRGLIGPEMPSAELLAAAAKLTEAESMLREAELKVDTDLFIGPPPPALVAEAESANEAERFEEITRIMGIEIEDPYDVLGVNHKMSIDNIKKRYWKLSLMVHPDKCTHPQAHQAFVILNKAFKDLQDPDKRKAMDEKTRLKEEQEKFEAELKVLREAAQWRRLQGISMAGDEELLAEPKLPPKRDEWMTTLPPERKPGVVSMQSTTSFSRTTKEGRGDTSIWTDTPLDKAQKAKMNYLEAYNEAAALASNVEKKRTSSDADLVDQYNHTKRSKSLVQKYREESSSHVKRKSKKEAKKEEWVGDHPWKPWDREKDLTAGRQNVNLDSEGMTKGLSSRFSSGSIQRNFL